MRLGDTAAVPVCAGYVFPVNDMHYPSLTSPLPAIILTLLTLEYLSHLNVEVACIWRCVIPSTGPLRRNTDRVNRRPFTHVKLLYVVARYVGLASAMCVDIPSSTTIADMVNRASEAWISHSLRPMSVPWDTDSCKTWLWVRCGRWCTSSSADGGR